MAGPRAVLFDVDGVLTVSWRPVAGAVEAVEAIRSAGLPVAFVTNTTSASRREIAGRLRAGGFSLEDGEVVTAARAAAVYLREHHRGARCLLLNSGSPGDDLAGVDLVESGADVVLTGGAGPEISYDLLNRAFRLLLEGADLVAMQRNSFWTTDGGPQLDMGPFVLGLERASGRQAVLVGKPAPAFFAAALEEVGAEAGDAVMVGDDVESDVLGAQACGLTGVLVRTGKFRQSSLEAAAGRPDHVLDSVADLPRLLGLAG